VAQEPVLLDIWPSTNNQTCHGHDGLSFRLAPEMFYNIGRLSVNSF